ncbi:MAG: BREX system ATP-binding protein BrxD [Gammaproteobacteria bacterium]|nr:BREX system ATP-binding protein BrxD [Gammaproteobacteria bacterium]
MISPQRRQEIVDALRRGSVPRRSLDAFAVGLERFEAALDDELGRAAAGRAVFKAVRGEYGTGKTFFARWLQERGKRAGFAVSEVQISEAETPLHRLETVYRRLIERLSTRDSGQGALRGILDSWFYALEEDVLADGTVDETDTKTLLARTDALMEQRLAAINRHAPAFSTALRGYRRAMAEGEPAVAEGILAWLGGEPNVGAAPKRYAGLKGQVDHFGALSFLQGLLVILRDAGFCGLLVVLDEVETLQRVRGDVREKSLNALRQLIDEVDAGRFPGLYLLMTGTPAFFDGPQGVQRLPPLAQRLAVDFSTEARFDNPRAVQIRLPTFDLDRLGLVGRRIRDVYAADSANAQRLKGAVDDDYIDDLARAVTGDLGGKVGVAPRIFLKKLVGEVLDRVDQFDDFDPRQHYALTLDERELTPVERAARSAGGVDDIELDL